MVLEPGLQTAGDMTALQWVTFVMCLLTIVVSGHFIWTTRKTDPYAAFSASILTSWLLHVAVFYICVLAVGMGNTSLRDFLSDIFQAGDFPLTTWSSAVRLHGILSVLTKETVAILVRRLPRKSWTL